MRIKAMVAENFGDYKFPSMFLASCWCDGKCAKDGNFPFEWCQNHSWIDTPILEVDDKEIIDRYLINPITKAFVFGGLEWLNNRQYPELFNFLKVLRWDYDCHDTVVIFTGYTEDECVDIVQELQEVFDNIIIKFGRYVPGEVPHRDYVLGVDLASSNQYAKRIC
jgi:hypothetical protein